VTAQLKGRDERELRELVAASGRILYEQELVDYLGHSSARVLGTDRVVIKPKHSPKTRGMHTLTADDMIVIDLDGNIVEGREKPPAEAYIHTEIYRARDDVLAVVHTHQPTATLMGVMNAEILPVLHVQAGQLGAAGMPIWPSPLLVTNPERGADLAAALGDANIGHLQGHGIVSVAPDIETATVQAIMLEQLAEANLRILQAGRRPRVIPTDEIAELQREMAPIEARWAYYLQLVHESVGREDRQRDMYSAGSELA
jgi:ribulose-5-phosphate 4-epimerase/fuculose-1-phosphate aldolase